MKYTVSVGNIGNIEHSNRDAANKAFNEYVRQSKGYTCNGRAYKESVWLFINDGPVKEFHYNNWMISKLESNFKRKQKVADKAQELLQVFKCEIGG